KCVGEDGGYSDQEEQGQQQDPCWFSVSSTLAGRGVISPGIFFFRGKPMLF
ncbi:MAG: hypothetical protein ACI8QF_003070, partial [Limisphaerales bacterium]